MLKPIVNPGLSLRARSLFYYFVEKGKVMSADALWASKEFPEGRDAIVNALNELKAFKYVRAVRTNTNGHWVHQLKFTEQAIQMLEESGVSTTPWKSGHMYVYRGTSINTSTSTSDLTTSDNSIDTVTNVTVSIGTQASPEGDAMGWNLDGEETAPKKRNQIDDSDAGAVGKLTDRQARLNAKYKKAPVVKDRSTTPEESWTTGDLVSEFYDIAREKTPAGITDQVNGQQLSTWINKKVGEGVTRPALLAGMRRFAADPRNFHQVGVGKPLYIRFFAYFQTVQGLVVAEVEQEPFVEDEEHKAYQENMLRLLKGE